MEDRCIGANYSMRFKDKIKSKFARNVSSPQYCWLMELLQLSWVDTSNFREAKMCYRCFKKYDRRRGGNLCKPVDLDAAAVDVEKDGKVAVTVSADTDDCDEDLNSDVDDSDANTDEDGVDDDDDDNDAEQDLKSVSASNQLPLFTIIDLLYGSASHRKCTICFQYADAGLVSLPKLAKRQLIFYRNLWCPDESRICSDYLIGEDWHQDVMVDVENRSPLTERLSDRAHQTINDLLFITHTISEHDLLLRLDFTRLNDKDCKTWTGWTLA